MNMAGLGTLGVGAANMGGATIGGNVGGGMGGSLGGIGGTGMSNPGGTTASPYGVVTCFICGKTGHYSCNCWQAASRQQPGEDPEMKELLRRIVKREKDEEERKSREKEEEKRKEEEERRESEKLREAEAREAATIVRILSQRQVPAMITPASQPVVIGSPSHAATDSKKRSPRSKARMLREIRSYIAESDDESDEVKEEAEKLIEAIESRKKGKKSTTILRAAASRVTRTPRKDKTRQATGGDVTDVFETPKKVGPAECSCEGVLEYALTQARALSDLKAPDLKKICDREGIDYIVKEQAIDDIARCRTRLAYEGFFDRDQATPSSKHASDIHGRFGESDIIIGTDRRRLRAVRTELVLGCNFRITKLAVTPTTVQRNKRYLRNLIAEPWRMRQLYRLSSSRLTSLYRTVGLFSRISTRNTIRLKIERVVRGNFGIDIRRRLVLKVPFSSDIVMRSIREIMMKVISASVKDHDIASLVLERMRLVMTKCKTVGGVVQNYRRALDNKQDSCTCADFYLARHEGHVRVRLDEISGIHQFVHNSKNVTKGRTTTVSQLVELIVRAIPKTWRASLLGIAYEDFRSCYRWIILVRVDGTAGFLRRDESEDHILSTAKKEYVESELHMLATWHTCGRIGRAYIIPKDKDLDWWRPISPSWSEPSRTASSRMGRSIRYMLRCLPERLHFSLRSTDDLKGSMEKSVAALSREGDTIVGRSYDIKDMFAKLPHQDIITSAVRLMDYHGRRGLTAVKVSVRGKACRMSRNLRKDDGMVTITLEKITGMRCFELKHNYTLCDGHVYQQTFGIPMGKHSSPALADLLFAKGEFDFQTALGSDRRLVAGLRMVDDVSLLIVFSAGVTSSYHRAMNIAELFEYCYPPSLKLVKKDDGRNTWEFLGCRIFVVPFPARVHIFPRTKNQPCLINSRKLHFHSMQDYASYTAKKVKKLTLTASMLRL
ncbi:hypothetical protein CBR_g55015 [Chara braunii]|uniref:CCHC-type domain-containing protein n=1 Tax=Chara braunii TaxID=69332 RepID=A0A388MCF6_CHABU|nr:hypothetical protein CBR_g55015 [Chara braunii]|eukprot:GBG92246.1 hypothetical protein CBR_g55015 [Chara braunii]